MDNFIKMKDFNDGHAYYVERESGRIAVADMGRFGRSGLDFGPGNTEDGVLYLDFMREPQDREEWDGWTYHHVPLIPEKGEPCSMSVSPAERKWIKETFNW